MIGQVPLQMLIPHTDTVSQTQQNVNQRAMVENSQATQTMEKHVEQAKDTVIPKDTVELHDYRYDAAEEGNNKYQDRRRKKRGEKDAEEDEAEEDKKKELQPRMNFDIKV